MKTWFVADTHFGHINILKHCKRPFSSIEEMDDSLIEAWNAKVTQQDTVYHLGDVAWRFAERYLDKLKGRLHLISGNHDHKDTRKLARWLSVQPFLELKDSVAGLIVLCHYPLHVWNRSHYGTWHLHGHCHGSLRCPGGRMLDVGVDALPGYAPIELSEIAEQMSKKVPRQVDHHNPPEGKDVGSKA